MVLVIGLERRTAHAQFPLFARPSPDQRPTFSRCSGSLTETAQCRSCHTSFAKLQGVSWSSLDGKRGGHLRPPRLVDHSAGWVSALARISWINATAAATSASVRFLTSVASFLARVRFGSAGARVPGTFPLSICSRRFATTAPTAARNSSSDSKSACLIEACGSLMACFHPYSNRYAIEAGGNADESRSNTMPSFFTVVESNMTVSRCLGPRDHS